MDLDEVQPQHYLVYTMDDGRKVNVTFIDTEEGTRLEQAFEPESENTEELQCEGWQAYLNNLKKYVELELL